MPPHIRLVAIDIDGTLLPSTGTTISQRNCEALRAAEAAGVHIVIATGRRQSYATPVLEQVGLSPQTVMISSNGAVTRRFSGELLHQNLLSQETSRALCSALRAFGQTFVFTFDRQGPDALIVEDLAAVRRQIEKWVEANREHIREIAPLERAFDGENAPIQGMMCGSVASMRKAEASIEARFKPWELATHRTEYPERDLGILDLLPPGCSKASALERLADSLGIGPAEVMAIGDNFNDQEMLEWAGRPVLMGNASAEMELLAERHGWLRTLSNDEHGVADVLERVLARCATEVTPASEAPEPAGVPSW
jgi:Cof subfamily protein (haloacid dehalogenase superfamily)